MGKQIRVFNLNGPTLADAGTTSPTEVSGTKATLHGVVNPEGLPVTGCKFEVGEAELPCEGPIPTDSANHQVTVQLTGLSPNTNYGYRLIVTNANGTNQSTRKILSTEPIAKTTPPTGVTPAEATLTGVVRPEGTPIGECRFEYAPAANYEYGKYEASLPCSPEAGSIPADEEPHTVSAQLAGLLVGTTYHYRIVASSGLGSQEGEDQVFTTLGPSVDGLSFSHVTESSAKLEALVNPRGKATTFHFEYGSEGPCASNPCASTPELPAGSGKADTEVSEEVEGLAPNTTYDFRIVVSNPDGTGQSSGSAFTTFKAPGSLPACPDETFRAGKPSAALPDCRVYEQATPIAKNGNDAAGGIMFKVEASVSGDGITSQTYGGMPGGEGAENYYSYLSQRGTDGWSTQGLLPPPSFGSPVHMIGWTPDLAYSFSTVGLVGSDSVAAVDRALLMRSSATHEVRQLTPYIDQAEYSLAGASADDSEIFIEAKGPTVNLTGNARVGKDNLYLYRPASEELSLVGVLPDGTTPAGGSIGGPFDWWSTTSPKSLLEGGSLGIESTWSGSLGYFLERMHAFSEDGSKAFFTAGGTGQIYVREGLDGEEPQTAHVSGSQRSAPDPDGPKPAIFMGATPSGSEAFFTSCEKLTDDSTAHATAADLCDSAEQGQDLYAYDTETKQLSDLTVDTEDPQGAEVMGFLGASDDGSYVYFVANADLDGGGPAEAGNCRHLGPLNWVGSCSAYVRHDGAITLVTNNLGSLEENLAPSSGTGATQFEPTSKVSADGKVLVFGGTEGLERYRFGESGIDCVTCSPTGAKSFYSLDSFYIAIGWPAGHVFAKRFVSESGNQVFFETRDKLVAADVNGDESCPYGTQEHHVPACQDVYEWEAPGAGSCSEASAAYTAHNGGCLYLLSSGTSQTPSYFGDASASGRDVFVFTRSRLVPSDKDDLTDIYDARVEGGLASQNEPPPPPPCEGGACRGSGTSAPEEQSAGTAGFSGPPDPAVKRGKKHHKHKHKRHKHKRHAHKRAGAGKGGQK